MATTKQDTKAQKTEANKPQAQAVSQQDAAQSPSEIARRAEARSPEGTEPAAKKPAEAAKASPSKSPAGKTAARKSPARKATAKPGAKPGAKRAAAKKPAPSKASARTSTEASAKATNPDAAKTAPKPKSPNAREAARVVGGTMPGVEAFFGGFDELRAFHKDTFDALFKSGSILAEGGRDISTLWLEMAQTSFEEGAELAKAMMTCHSVPEFVEMQNDVAKASYDKMFSEGRRISELSVRMAEDVTEPIAERIALAVEKMSKPIAA